MQSEEPEIKSVAGGEYDQMAEWANEHLPSEEIDASTKSWRHGTTSEVSSARIVR